MSIEKAARRAKELSNQGTLYNVIAKTLNKEGHKTKTGVAWSGANVYNVAKGRMKVRKRKATRKTNGVSRLNIDIGAVKYLSTTGMSDQELGKAIRSFLL